MKVLVIVGLVFSLIGGAALAWLFIARSKVTKQIQAALYWPEATAVVDIVDFKGFTAYVFGQRIASWKPVFSCRFTAGGQTFTGDRIIFGTVQETSPYHIRKLIAPYAPGQWIQVRYNPYDPRDSVVELRHPRRPLAGLIVVNAMVAIGLLLIVLGASGVGPNVGGGRTSSSSR